MNNNVRNKKRPTLHCQDSNAFSEALRCISLESKNISRNLNDSSISKSSGDSPVKI